MNVVVLANEERTTRNTPPILVISPNPYPSHRHATHRHAGVRPRFSSMIKVARTSFLAALGLMHMWSNLSMGILQVQVLAPAYYDENAETLAFFLPTTRISNPSNSEHHGSYDHQYFTPSNHTALPKKLTEHPHDQHQQRQQEEPLLTRRYYYQVQKELYASAQSTKHNSQTSYSRITSSRQNKSSLWIPKLPDNHTNKNDNKNHNNGNSNSHGDGDGDDWFTHPPPKICHNSCCAQQVAIPMNHEERHLLNTMDGLDLADLYFQHKPSGGHLTFAGSLFHPDLIPCLQPGTTIHLNNKNYINSYFWNHIRPQIQVPFVLITSDSDFDSPLSWKEDYGDHMNDTLLIKWYGANPNYSGPVADKFEPLPLGLATRFPQAKYLEPYLALNHFANPFLGLDAAATKKTTTAAAVIPHHHRNSNSNSNNSTFDLDWDKDVFVFFGTKGNRRKLWNQLCDDSRHNNYNKHHHQSKTSERMTTMSGYRLSCNATAVASRVSPHEVYEQASRGYRFAISPPGFGWDCYRTYEWLYLGLIPIVEERRGADKKNSHRLFQGLPVIQVPNLLEASRETILQHVQFFLQGRPRLLTAPGWNKLFLAYWRRKIWKDAGRQITTHRNGTEYYMSWKYYYETSSSSASTTRNHNKGRRNSKKGRGGIYCAHSGNCGRD